MKIAAILLVMALLGVVGILSLCGPRPDVSRGVLFLAGSFLLAVTSAFEIGLRVDEKRRTRRAVSRFAERPEVERAAAGREFLSAAIRSLDELEKKAVKWAPGPKGTPEDPRPQTFDFDNGKCPYKRDPSKPLGSKENPVVAGIPESSTHLVFSTDRGCWILTDGLGNGWIR